MLKDSIPAAMERIEEFVFPGGKIKLGRQIRQARKGSEAIAAQPRSRSKRLPKGSDTPPAEYLALAQSFPEAAVTEAFRKVEAIIQGCLDLLPGTPASNLSRIVRELWAKGIINMPEYHLFRHAREVRNSTVHNVKAITPGEALEYWTICETLISALTAAFERAKSGDPASLS